LEISYSNNENQKGVDRETSTAEKTVILDMVSFHRKLIELKGKLTWYQL